MTTSRRTLLGALLLSPRLAPARTDELPAAWAQLERTRGGRLGVCLLDTASGQTWSHRGAERFGLCSTFKLPLAAAVLQAIDQGRLAPDARLPLRAAERLPHMPVTEPLLARGWATPLELAEATQVTSDNLAANVLLRQLGGPEAFTRWLREQGDPVTQVERYEPELNRVRPGEARDSSSPEAFAATVARLATGPVLSPARREQLVQWMVATQTGQHRLRAGLPKDWRAGDKTGTAFSEGLPDRINDTAVFWPPGRAPWVLSGFYEGPTRSREWVRREDEALLAEVARRAAAFTRRAGKAV